MSTTAPWVGPFLEHLKTTSNMAASCRAVGVIYGTMMQLRLRDADFAAAVEDALEQAYDEMEAECRRRAFAGIEEPVVYQGQLTPIFARNPDGSVVVDPETGVPQVERDADGNPKFLTLKKYSDSMAMFLMKGYRRRKFGDKQEITGEGGGPLQIVDESKRAARVAQLIAAAQSRKDHAKDNLDDLA